MLRSVFCNCDFAWLLLFVFVILLQSTCIESLDFTVDDPACDTMIPTYNENTVERRHDFGIRVFDENGIETHEYDSANAKVLYVRVEGGPYERAQLQARSLEYPTSQVGRFIKPLPKYFRLANCSGVHGGAVINDEYVYRRHASLAWLPPQMSRGAIVFFASVIRDSTLFHIRSSFLTPTTANIHVDNRGCGRSHSCFKVGDEGCVFGETCRFSLKWRCYKQSMLVEGVQSAKMAAFGFATSDKRGVMCVSSGDGGVYAMDVFIFGDNAFPNVFERSRSKRLKAAEDLQRIYCRFEMERPKANSTEFIYGEVDMYGHPYKLKRWKVPVGDVCEPRSIHSTASRGQGHLSLAALTGSSPTRRTALLAAHCLFLLLWIALRFVQ